MRLLDFKHNRLLIKNLEAFLTYVPEPQTIEKRHTPMRVPKKKVQNFVHCS